VREGKLQFAPDADGILLGGRGGGGCGEGADGLGDGDQRRTGGGGLENSDDAGAVGRARVEEDWTGDEGEAAVVAERHGGLEGGFESG